MTSEPPVRGRSSLLASLDAQLEGARPDFGAVLGRVQAGEGEDAFEEHVDLGEPPPIVAEACEALRARIESELGQRMRREPVPPRLGRGTARVWAAVGIVAAAALLLLLLNPPSFLRGSQMDEDAQQNLAVDEARPEEGGGQARFGTPPDTAKAVAPRKNVTPPPGPEVVSEPEVEPEPEAEPARQIKAPAVSMADRLAALDKRAQEKWSAGDVDGARRDFRKIVRLGGKRKRVELAYAELFALARQRGEDLSSLWREYLRKFPKGRYARDASAGLCRAESAGKREACWNAHRERFGEKAGGGRG